MYEISHCQGQGEHWALAELGVAGGNRTHNLMLRRHLLYPVELRPRMNTCRKGKFRTDAILRVV